MSLQTEHNNNDNYNNSYLKYYCILCFHLFYCTFTTETQKPTIDPILTGADAGPKLCSGAKLTLVFS